MTNGPKKKAKPRSARLKDEDRLVTRAQLNRALNVALAWHEQQRHAPWWRRAWGWVRRGAA